MWYDFDASLFYNQSLKLTLFTNTVANGSSALPIKRPCRSVAMRFSCATSMLGLVLSVCLSATNASPKSLSVAEEYKSIRR
jgi:hypothetical protein